MAKRIVDDTDDFESYLADQMKDPVYAQSYREALSKERGFTSRLCDYGNCNEMYNPDTGEVNSSIGPADCPCQEGRRII